LSGPARQRPHDWIKINLNKQKKGKYMSSASLKYNSETYKNAYNSCFVIEFNHGPFTKGEIDEVKCDEIRKRCNEIVKKISSSVSFDSQIESSLTGGSCTTIAFRIIKVAYEAIKSSGNIETAVQNEISSLLQIGKARSNEASSKRKEIRTNQAALNTISISNDARGEDRSNDKAKALAACFGFRVIASSKEITTDSIPEAEQQFTSMQEGLPKGVYLVRTIKKEANHKQETQGHSTVFINAESQGTFYFDTQIGFYALNKMGKEMHALIYRSMRSLKEHFQVDACRFHLLQAEEC
jgi:hypothetical protein